VRGDVVMNVWFEPDWWQWKRDSRTSERYAEATGSLGRLVRYFSIRATA